MKTRLLALDQRKVCARVVLNPPPAGSRRTAANLHRLRKRLRQLFCCLLLWGWRAVTWPLRSRWRLLSSAWLVGFFWIGQAVTAIADDGGPVVGPDLGSAGGQTVFEQYGPQKFSLYLQLSDSNHGAPYVSQTMWEMLRAIESALTYMVFLLARGAITSMEWLLNLHIYADNSAQIDAAVRAVAAQVFWPLFGATLAIGAFSAYARMKREGGGSLFNDASWLIAASTFAVAFVSGPSVVMGQLDDLRTDLAAAAMTGYSSYAPAGVSAAGFPAANLPADQAGATRKLADAMWNVYVVAPWCYVNFNSMTECSDVGKDYIQGNDRWKALTNWMCGSQDSDGCTDVGGNSDDTRPPYCPEELNADCDWIRGQSFGRLGAALFVTIVDVPLVAMLLVLVMYGIMAVLGFIMLLLLGVFFVLGWMIPGRLRQMGVRWFEEALGALLQSVIITAVIGSVMVIDATLNLAIPTYGFFMVGLLNLATFIVGFRLRGKLENITGIGSGTTSPFSNYLAMRAVGSIGKGAMRLGGSAAVGGYRAAPVLAGAGMGAARFGGQLAGATYRGGAQAGRRLRCTADTLLYGARLQRPAADVAVAPPQYQGGAGAGRTVLEPARSTDPDRTAGGAIGKATELPVGKAADVGRRHQLAAAPASGIEVQHNDDGSRRFVDATHGMPPRTFIAGGAGTATRPGSELASSQRRPDNTHRPIVDPSTPVEPAPAARATRAYSSPPTRLAVHERASVRPVPQAAQPDPPARWVPPVQPASTMSAHRAPVGTVGLDPSGDGDAHGRVGSSAVPGSAGKRPVATPRSMTPSLLAGTSPRAARKSQAVRTQQPPAEASRRRRRRTDGNATGTERAEGDR